MKLVLGALALAVLSQVATAENATFTDSKGGKHGLGFLKPKAPKLGVTYWAPKAELAAPAEYDLRTLGLVSPIKNQGQCGSCWAFSLTKSHESARLKAGVSPLSLSEQEVVDCDNNAAGCNGGNMDDGQWIVDHGQATEADYPYTARDGRCKQKTVAAKPARYVYIGASGRGPTVDEIKTALMQYGVLSTTVAAGGSDWDGGNGGVMDDCSNRGTNHMVNISGWAVKNGKEYLIGANSWGTSWGDKGFFYTHQGCDEYATGDQSVGTFVVDGGPAPTPPHVQLPAEVDVYPGTEVMLGVKAEQGVQYSWTADGVATSDTDSMIYVTPTKDTVYQVTAKTAAGTAQSSVKVHVLAAPN